MTKKQKREEKKEKKKNYDFINSYDFHPKFEIRQWKFLNCSQVNY